MQRKILNQWFFAITKYADKLLIGENSSWPKQVLEIQRNWIGKRKDGSFRIRDWLVSRQRFWGTPIPIVYCDSCGTVPVEEQNIPVELPNDLCTSLDKHPTWKYTLCPKCNSNAIRETDTLDTFVDSSFYYLRFLDCNNPTKLIEKDKIQPVDLYIGGLEHCTSHLLYARFIWLFLMEEFNANEEEFPFKRLINQGMVCGKTYKNKVTGKYLTDSDQLPATEVEECWEKMSKSKNNGVNPLDIIEKYGVDVTRLGILFKSPLHMDMKWTEIDIVGQKRWLNRVLTLIPIDNNEQELFEAKD